LSRVFKRLGESNGLAGQVSPPSYPQVRPQCQSTLPCLIMAETMLMKVLVLVVAVGVQDRPAEAPQEGPWDRGYVYWGQPNFAQASAAVSGIVLSYAGTSVHFPLLAEMREPRHYNRAMFTCQIIVICFYLVGILLPVALALIAGHRLDCVPLRRTVRRDAGAWQCGTVAQARVLRSCHSGSGRHDGHVHPCAYLRCAYAVPHLARRWADNSLRRSTSSSGACETRRISARTPSSTGWSGSAQWSAALRCRTSLPAPFPCLAV